MFAFSIVSSLHPVVAHHDNEVFFIEAVANLSHERVEPVSGDSASPFDADSYPSFAHAQSSPVNKLLYHPIF